MSKTFRIFLPVFAAGFILLFPGGSSAQDIEVKLSPGQADGHSVFVQVRRLDNPANTGRSFAFMTAFSGKEFTANRISHLNIHDLNGRALSYKRLSPGEYLADANVVSWSYFVDLTPPNDPSLRSHVSWMSDNTGVLTLDDLLPQFDRGEKSLSANVTFENKSILPGPPLPPIFGPERSRDAFRSANAFTVEDVVKAVFYIGNSWKGGFLLDGPRTPTTLIALGESPANYDQTVPLIAEIGDAYSRLFGDGPSSIILAIVKLNANTGQWNADTRGSTITILTSDPPFAAQTMQRRHEQLRHEMFHLWIPNGVNLTGSYDWFYEGFALYQSLKLGVEVNRIRFDDYLDTLSRTFDIDSQQSHKLSLIDASKNRWNGGNNTTVYARGMLVAFLCDLALLDRSRGKRSVTDVLRTIYEKHRPPAAEADGNAAVLALFRSHSELIPIIERNVVGVETIDWANFLRAAGLEAEMTNNRTKLKVTAKLNGRQKNLLDKLGYNNWRKLSKGN